MFEEILIFLNEKRKIIGLISLLVCLAFLIAYPYLLFQKQGKVKGTSLITVEISGAVKNPGVYNLEPGQRVEDLINKAGGLKNADPEFLAETLNRARKLQDGEKIFIPQEQLLAEGAQPTDSKTQEKALNTAQNATSSSKSSSATTFPININKASASQLEALPGIGPVYAQRIIEYRQSHGGFKNKEEIKEIKGIGDKTYEKIKDLISI